MLRPNAVAAAVALEFEQKHINLRVLRNYIFLYISVPRNILNIAELISAIRE